MKGSKKVNVAQVIIMILVVFILLCGIFSIFRRLTGTGFQKDFGDNDGAGNSASTTEVAEETTEAKADNSVPMTSFTVVAPEPSIRVGKTMQLEITCEPANATNKEIKWSFNQEGLITIDENGLLTPNPDSAKNTVTVVAETTDGSNLKQTFDLRIYPELDPSKPMVAITFDDGPYDKTTPTMLDALEANYAKATFFCLGQNTEYFPDIVKREYDLGMQVGTHTYDHTQLTTLDRAGIEDNISKAISAFSNATGGAPLTIMRPPYGSINADVQDVCKEHGIVCMEWSLDTEDWKTKDADATYNMVMTCEDGDVVLLHDIHNYNVAAVQRFVPDLIEKGFQLVTVAELYEAKGESLLPGTNHYRPDKTPAAATSEGEGAQTTEAGVQETETTDLD